MEKRQIKVIVFAPGLQGVPFVISNVAPTDTIRSVILRAFLILGRQHDENPMNWTLFYKDQPLPLELVLREHALWADMAEIECVLKRKTTDHFSRPMAVPGSAMDIDPTEPDPFAPPPTTKEHVRPLPPAPPARSVQPAPPPAKSTPTQTAFETQQTTDEMPLTATFSTRRSPSAPEEFAARSVPSTDTKRATVRFYNRMNPQRLFPLLVIFSKQMIQRITKRATDQQETGPFEYEKEKPVDIEPIIPGCTCHPPRITTQLSHAIDTLVFYVVPNVIGKIKGAKVVVKQEHKTLAEVELKVKVVQRTWFYISAFLTILLPFMSALIKHFGLDFATQMQTEFNLYLQIGQLLFAFVSPLVLTIVLACVTVIAYVATRPKRKDEFWEIRAKTS